MSSYDVQAACLPPCLRAATLPLPPQSGSLLLLELPSASVPLLLLFPVASHRLALLFQCLALQSGRPLVKTVKHSRPRSTHSTPPPPSCCWLRHQQLFMQHPCNS